MRLVFNYGLNENIKFPIKITAIKTRTGRKVKVVSIPATLSFLRAYAIQDAMANPRGQIGYDQTTITKFHASCVTPESNAMTDNPAMSNQKNRDASANSCEMINQIRMGFRVGGFASKLCSYSLILHRGTHTAV